MKLHCKAVAVWSYNETLCAGLLIFRQDWLSEKVEIVDIYHFYALCKCRLTRPVRASELRKLPGVSLKPVVNNKWHTRQLQITTVSEHQNFWKRPPTLTHSTRNMRMFVSQSISKLVRCEKAGWKNRDGSTQLNYTSYLLFSSTCFTSAWKAHSPTLRVPLSPKTTVLLSYVTKMILPE